MIPYEFAIAVAENAADNGVEVERERETERERHTHTQSVCVCVIVERVRK